MGLPAREGFPQGPYREAYFFFATQMYRPLSFRMLLHRDPYMLPYGPNGKGRLLIRLLQGRLYFA